MRRLAWLAVLAAALFAAAWIGSPFLAYRHIRDAAQNGDALQMARGIAQAAPRPAADFHPAAPRLFAWTLERIDLPPKALQ